MTNFYCFKITDFTFLKNKEFRTKVPTHFVRNSISNINVRKDREFLPSFEPNRGGSRVGQRMSVIR